MCKQTSYTRLCPGSRKANAAHLSRGSDFSVALVKSTRHAKARAKDRSISHFELEKLISSRRTWAQGDHRVTNGQLTVVVSDRHMQPPRILTAFRQNQSIFNLQRKNTHMAARCASAEAAAIGEPEFYPLASGGSAQQGTEPNTDGTGTGQAQLQAAGTAVGTAPPVATHAVRHKASIGVPSLQYSAVLAEPKSKPKPKRGQRQQPLRLFVHGNMNSSVYTEYRRHIAGPSMGSNEAPLLQAETTHVPGEATEATCMPTDTPATAPKPGTQQGKKGKQQGKKGKQHGKKGRKGREGKGASNEPQIRSAKKDCAKKDGAKEG